MSIRILAGQTAVYGVSSIVARMLNYLLTPYITRVLSEGEYGVITDLYSLIPFALVVLTMGLESGYFRFAGKAGSILEKERVFSTVWTAVATASLVFVTLVFLFRGAIASATGYTEFPSFILMTAGIIALDAFTAVPYARLRERGRAGTYVLVRCLSVALTIVLCIFFYSGLPALAARGIMTGLYDPAFGPGYYLLGNLIVSFVTVFMLLPTLRGVKIKPSAGILRSILLYSLPLLLSGIAGTANEFIDRQMIKYLMPSDVAMQALGVYGAVVKIGVILLLFTQMYRLAAEPFFLADFKKEDFVRTNAEAMKYFIIVSVGIFLGITLFTDLFRLLVGPAFREGMYILPVVLIGNILSGVVLNLSFWYKQMSRTSFALLVTGTGLVFTVVFNIMLVPALGIYGAALARLSCEAAMAVLSYVLNRRYCPTPYDLKRIGIYAGAGALIYGCGLLSAHLPQILKYTVNTALLATFAIMAVSLERIDIKSVFRKKL
ncbi:MAG: oligosaccharide flippase family protein [Rikenellaceae bacterium]|nr:oligosaccharide flippase family protein [Rikenellaceae bacterium]